MLGDLDPLDFVLAEKLSMSLRQVRALPQAEITEWAAYLTWRGAMARFEADKAWARRG